MPVNSATVLLRLGCLAFGTGAGVLFPKHLPLPASRTSARSSAWVWLDILLGICKVVVSCAVALLVVPLPVSVTFLYTGTGILAAAVGAEPDQWQHHLPVVCAWMILYLPFTGVLACLGGVLLVLAAEVPGVSVLAVLVFAAPMALLQFGPEGGLVLLATAAMWCIWQAGYHRLHRKNTGLFPG